jgi:hypothetical protein
MEEVMRNVLHAYEGSFDELGRLTIVPVQEGGVTTELPPGPECSIWFNKILTDEQRNVLTLLGQVLCQSVGGVLDGSGNGRHMWPPLPREKRFVEIDTDRDNDF